jgi:hypothetical protein
MVQAVLNARTANAGVMHEVYPNPATDYLHIKAIKGTSLQLADVYGRLLYHSVILNKEESIPVKDFAPGIYYLKLQQDGVMKTERISILH